MLFISPAIRSAGRRLERLRCRTDRKSRSIAPWIAASDRRVEARHARRAAARSVWAKPRSSRSSTLAATSARISLRITAAVCGCSPGGSSRWRRPGCRSAAPRRCGCRRGRRRAGARPRPRRGPRRAACAPPWLPPEISGPAVSASRNSTITASSTSWLTLPSPPMARAKRSMSGSARSAQEAAASSGPMAVRIIAAFSIGLGIGSPRSADEARRARASAWPGPAPRSPRAHGA